MAVVALTLSTSQYESLGAHLLPGGDVEQVAFVFARPAAPSAGLILECIDWYGIPANGFVVQSGYHVELTDAARGAAIKHAHDLGSALVEFHSHPFHGGACFSPSDITGLRELVPHVRWRLKGRPYMAFVLALDGFDGLAWSDPGDAPVQADGLLIDGRLMSASRRTLARGWDFDD